MIEILAGTGLIGRKIALGIGVFDGVHRGHQLLLRRLREQAAAAGALPVGLTFDPHPRAVLQPRTPPVLLMCLEERIRLLKEYGAAEVLLVRFTAEFAALSPEEFLERLVKIPAEVVGICVGEHWRFGAGGRGDAGFLAAYCAEHGLSLIPVPELRLGGRVVSSSNLRQAISAGRLAEAAEMLGRPYRLNGMVEPGFGVAGTELSFPTANVRLECGILPPDGVYAGVAKLANGRRFPAAVNIGLAPTFRREGGDRRLEVHLLGFSGDLYREKIAVDLLDHLRSERTFAGPAELKEQIGRDIEAIRRRMNEVNKDHKCKENRSLS